jgi:hypothetical protein
MGLFQNLFCNQLQCQLQQSSCKSSVKLAWNSHNTNRQAAKQFHFLRKFPTTCSCSWDPLNSKDFTGLACRVDPKIPNALLKSEKVPPDEKNHSEHVLCIRLL